MKPGNFLEVREEKAELLGMESLGPRWTRSCAGQGWARDPVPMVTGEGLVVAKPTLSLEFEP